MEPTAIRFGNVINMAVPVDNSLDPARAVDISGIARIENGHLLTLENGLVHELPDTDAEQGTTAPSQSPRQLGSFGLNNGGSLWQQSDRTDDALTVTTAVTAFINALKVRIEASETLETLVP